MSDDDNPLFNRLFDGDNYDARCVLLSVQDLDLILEALDDQVGSGRREQIVHLIARLRNGNDESAKVCHDCSEGDHIQCAQEWVVVVPCGCKSCAQTYGAPQ